MAIEIGYYITMVSKNIETVNLKGSSLNLPAHWEGGARARCLPGAAKISVRPRKNTAEGGCGGNSAVFLQKNRGQPRRLLCQEQKPAKKFSFPFRRKNPARANQEKRRKLFCWLASVSERRRDGFIRRGFAENAFEFRSGYGAAYNNIPTPDFGLLYKHKEYVRYALVAYLHLALLIKQNPSEYKDHKTVMGALEESIIDTELREKLVAKTKKLFSLMPKVDFK